MIKEIATSSTIIDDEEAVENAIINLDKRIISEAYDKTKEFCKDFLINQLYDNL